MQAPVFIVPPILPSGATRRRLGELPMRGKERPFELDMLEAEAGAGAAATSAC